MDDSSIMNGFLIIIDGAKQDKRTYLFNINDVVAFAYNDYYTGSKYDIILKGNVRIETDDDIIIEKIKKELEKR